VNWRGNLGKRIPRREEKGDLDRWRGLISKTDGPVVDLGKERGTGAGRLTAIEKREDHVGRGGELGRSDWMSYYSRGTSKKKTYERRESKYADIRLERSSVPGGRGVKEKNLLALYLSSKRSLAEPNL